MGALFCFVLMGLDGRFVTFLTIVTVVHRCSSLS